MSNEINKYDLFHNMKDELENKGFEVFEIKEINYGLQFPVKLQGQEHLIRIYQSKKGTRVDLSQVKDGKVLNLLEELLSLEPSQKKIRKEKSQTSDMKEMSFKELIGTDESGKGDYFGPLVVAGVYVDSKTANTLLEFGVMDSKKISDNQIREIAPSIKKLCPYAIVAIGNEKYNELYKKMGNLNKLLAWGHARVIENILEKVDCQQVLSDQFGDEKLIKNALLKKGQSINLYQRPRAEENIAVAAASVLARFEYISRLEKLSRIYGMNLPKGASNSTVQAAKSVVNDFGIHELSKIAKLHFKTTEQVKGMTP